MNRRFILISLCLHNLLTSLALICSGLVHQYFYVVDTPGNWLFWKLCAAFLGLAFPFFTLYPIFYINKIKNNMAYLQIFIGMIVSSLLIGIEEFIFMLLGFATTLFLAFIVVGVVAVYTTVNMERILDPSLRCWVG